MIGSILIVAGLYSVLWGKYKESKEKEKEAEIIIIPEAIKGLSSCNNTNTQNGKLQTVMEESEENDIEMQISTSTEATKDSSSTASDIAVVINVSKPLTNVN